MKNFPLLLCLCFLSISAQAQLPDRPLRPLVAYTLEGYTAVDVEEAFSLPDELAFDSVTAVDFNSQGNLIVLHRGPQPFLEFDPEGNFIRAFGDEALFVRSHGLTIDMNDNLWVTDAWGHTVMKLDSEANIVFTLGTRNQSGLWDEQAGTHLFDQPNDVAIDSDGNFYVAQGHGIGEPRILKFTADGDYIQQWGARGSAPGELAVAHAIAIDDNDLLYVADRENHRVQQFNTDGTYLGEWAFNAMACAIYLHSDGFAYLSSGFDGEIAKLDMQGNIIGSLGRPGQASGQFGEAHFLTVDSDGNIFVADVVNRRVQKFQVQSD